MCLPHLQMQLVCKAFAVQKSRHRVLIVRKILALHEVLDVVFHAQKFQRIGDRLYPCAKNRIIGLRRIIACDGKSKRMVTEKKRRAVINRRMGAAACQRG